MEGEVMGSRPIRCITYQLKKLSLFVIVEYGVVNVIADAR